MKKKEETSGIATEEGSIALDGKTCNTGCMHRTEQPNHNLQIALTEYLIPEFHAPFLFSPCQTHLHPRVTCFKITLHD